MTSSRGASLLLLVGAVACQGATPDGPTWWAIGTPYEAYELRSDYTHGTFRAFDVDPTMFPIGERLRGIGKDGRAVSIRLDSLNPYYPDLDYYDPTFYVTVDGRSSAPRSGTTTRAEMREAVDRFIDHGYEDVVLFWTTSLRVTGLPTVPDSLSAADRPKLRGILDSLFDLANRQLPPDERRNTFLVRRESEVRPGTDSSVVVGWWQIQVDGRDNRGSFFFIWHRDSARVSFASFGHPEWSPQSTIIAVRPHGFFRIRGDERTYVFGEYQHAWEDMGFAIIDLASGDVVAQTY